MADDQSTPDVRTVTVDQVVDLVAKLTHGGPRPAITNRDQARAWVLAQLAEDAS